MLKGLYGKLIKRFDGWEKRKRLADKRAMNIALKEIRGGGLAPDVFTGAPAERAR